MRSRPPRALALCSAVCCVVCCVLCPVWWCCARVRGAVATTQVAPVVVDRLTSIVLYSQTIAHCFDSGLRLRAQYSWLRRKSSKT